MRTWRIPTAHTLARAALALALLLAAAPAAAQFNCLPSCASDDARLLAIAAGGGFQTLSDPVLDLTFTVPAGTPSFQVGIFDGDAIGGSAGPPPDIHWDTGLFTTVPVFHYTLFADPGASVGGTQVVAGPFVGSTLFNPDNELPDNAWFDFTVATGAEAQTATGDYVYRLHIELMNPDTATVLNGFKVRTSEIATIEPIAQPFGYIAQLTNFDNSIVYPDGVPAFPGDPVTTTYDGGFSFFIEAPATQSAFVVWDGDFDRGDAANPDTLDPNTPGAPFEPAWATADTMPEGAAGTGAPADNTTNARFFRAPAIRYDLITPDLQSFPNDNPSGNQEWELFKISTMAGDPTADWTTALGLPAGAYELRIDGLDMANLNFLLTQFRVICTQELPPGAPPGTAPEPCELPPSDLFAVGDTVFEDLDGSTTQDFGEPGIQGVVVNLVGTGGVIDTAVTDANGEYFFAVRPATYTVEVAAENFAVPAAGAFLGDTVWHDANANGTQDAGEPGIANVSLHLYLDGGDLMNDGADDTFVALTSTDPDGNYLFRDLAPGSYWVDVVDFTVPDGLALVTAGGATDPSAVVTLAAGGSDLFRDFPYAGADPTKVVIGDYVWSDADGDGFQDAGEAGIGGVTLEIYNINDPGNPADDVLVAETRTTADGSYLFTGLTPGLNYQVRVTDTAAVLTGYSLTASLDSPAATATFLGATAGDVTLLDGDFGYQNAALADITDSVWRDTNRDGLRDEALTGFGGVTVNLVGGQGQAIATATTDGNGDFTFADLPPGTYSLVITDLGQVLNGYVATTTGSARGFHTVNLGALNVTGESFGWIDTPALEAYAGTTPGNDGDTERETQEVVNRDVLTYDFGYALLGSIGNRVWEDVNGDGFQDLGEPGINGVTVTLYDGNGDFVASQTTSGDGNYLFEDLVPGDYTVVVDKTTVPAGLEPTWDFDDMVQPITTPNQASVTLAAGQHIDEVDFGYDQCGECDGKVTQLALQYLGSEEAQIRVVAKRGKDLDVIFDDTVEANGLFGLTPPANDVARPGHAGTLGTEIRIYVDDALATTIHTSCSVPIGPGLVSGDFLVVWGTSRNGGLLCPLADGGGDPTDCGPCSGKVTNLTLRYKKGLEAFIEVVQKKPEETVFAAMVMANEEFFVSGTDKKGTLGTEISIYVDGELDTTIHTSCSVPIGPGSVFGNFEVIAGASRDGGPLCEI